jgi:hypothetical protein
MAMPRGKVKRHFRQPGYRPERVNTEADDVAGMRHTLDTFHHAFSGYPSRIVIFARAFHCSRESQKGYAFRQQAANR